MIKSSPAEQPVWPLKRICPFLRGPPRKWISCKFVPVVQDMQNLQMCGEPEYWTLWMLLAHSRSLDARINLFPCFRGPGIAPHHRKQAPMVCIYGIMSVFLLRLCGFPPWSDCKVCMAPVCKSALKVMTSNVDYRQLNHISKDISCTTFDRHSSHNSHTPTIDSRWYWHQF